ncbi:hypothetical protein RRG08_066854, partial [Elysia crispata]
WSRRREPVEVAEAERFGGRAKLGAGLPGGGLLSILALRETGMVVEGADEEAEWK